MRLMFFKINITVASDKSQGIVTASTVPFEYTRKNIH